jgi:hypothetical protein
MFNGPANTLGAMVTTAAFLMAWLSVAGGYNEFCNGFAEGYKAGWCQGSSMCMEPMVPMCPMAPMGRDNYPGGYAVGFRAAMDRR